MSLCAFCKEKPCQTGNMENAPRECPTVLTNAEKELSRYDEEDRKISVTSAKVEAGGYRVLTRMEEIMEFAIGMGYRHLGLAFCAGLSQEALTVAKILKANGFEVDSVCCKNGSVPKDELGITSKYYAGNNCEFEPMCNPVGQAHVLDEAGCELSIILGLCVGHDTLFIKHSETPVTVLAAKDRVTGHNPLGPIYNADSYRTDLYDYVNRRKRVFKFSEEIEIK